MKRAATAAIRASPTCGTTAIPAPASPIFTPVVMSTTSELAACRRAVRWLERAQRRPDEEGRDRGDPGEAGGARRARKGSERLPAHGLERIQINTGEGERALDQMREAQQPPARLLAGRAGRGDCRHSGPKAQAPSTTKTKTAATAADIGRAATAAVDGTPDAEPGPASGVVARSRALATLPPGLTPMGADDGGEEVERRLPPQGAAPLPDIAHATGAAPATGTTHATTAVQTMGAALETIAFPKPSPAPVTDVAQAANAAQAAGGDLGAAVAAVAAGNMQTTAPLSADGDDGTGQDQAAATPVLAPTETGGPPAAGADLLVLRHVDELPRDVPWNAREVAALLDPWDAPLVIQDGGTPAPTMVVWAGGGRPGIRRVDELSRNVSWDAWEMDALFSPWSAPPVFQEGAPAPITAVVATSKLHALMPWGFKGGGPAAGTSMRRTWDPGIVGRHGRGDLADGQ